MATFKRVFFFIIVNVLVMATISIILSVLGVGRYVDAYGLNIPKLVAFCLVWGMSGAFISLLISRWMVKRMMGIQLIDPNAASGAEREVYEMVRRLSTAAGIPMPEVGIYDSPELNAFATGPTKKRSLIAVSTGLLEAMNRSEVEGVIGHEVSHIANGDMVTMTLIQGVVNAFAMFLSRVISFAVSRFVNEDLEFIVRFVLTLVLDILFTILGSIVVCYFSRIREYKADRDSAKIAGRDKMIAALRRLQANMDAPVDNRGDAIASFKISGKKKFLLFATHPPLEDRIAALENANL